MVVICCLVMQCILNLGVGGYKVHSAICFLSKVVLFEFGAVY